MTNSVSSLQVALNKDKSELPDCLQDNSLTLVEGEPTSSVADSEDIQKLFPGIFGKKSVTFTTGGESSSKLCNVGVILSGGQAPGGHNVICGLLDALKKENSSNKLYGFLGGPAGLMNGEYRELTEEYVAPYRNTGGFDIIGSGRTKLESSEQFDQVHKTCNDLNITAIVVIGGDDSNTNAATLAQYLIEKDSGIQVIGVPKTIDGDLKSKEIEVSFGFDTAAKVYSELVGNIQRDANSAKKYWHFIKLMGRSASHIALEVGLQTHPNITLISEEVLEGKVTLNKLVEDICDGIIKRSEVGKNFGIVLVPEGLIEFIPEMRSLISSLNDLLAHHENHFKTLNDEEQVQFVSSHLSKDDSYVFSSLPLDIQLQMLADRDDHGNVSVSKIETEKLLISLCHSELVEKSSNGEYKGKFSPIPHFFGYGGRCAFPTRFDARYTYALGYTAFQLIKNELSGYIVSIRNTNKPLSEWQAGGTPLTQLMNMEQRKGKMKPVIQKALVELDGAPFKVLQENRQKWLMDDDYVFPGPVQFFGPEEVCGQASKTLELEHS